MCHSRVSCGSNRGTPRNSRKWCQRLRDELLRCGCWKLNSAALWDAPKASRVNESDMRSRIVREHLWKERLETNRKLISLKHEFKTKRESEGSVGCVALMRIKSKYPWKTMADCQSPGRSSSRPVFILSFLSNNYHCFEGLKVRLAEQKGCLICSFTAFRHILLVCWVRLSWFVW